MKIKKFLIGAAMVLLAATSAACSNSKSASKSGATAIASATAKHSYDNTAYETKKLTVRLTCSSTGVLS